MSKLICKIPGCGRPVRLGAYNSIFCSCTCAERARALGLPLFLTAAQAKEAREARFGATPSAKR